MGKRQLSEKDQVGDMIEWLAAFGKTKKGGVTRLLYSPPWRAAQQALKNKMDQMGFYTYFDSVGNLFGKLQGCDKLGKAILTGSHIDTVVDGGKYDGAYGVIASLLAASRLFQTYGSPRKTIEVVSLCEEEGSRFPLTFWGSRNINGMYNLDCVKDVQDSHGISFLEAMRQAGFNPDQYTPPVRYDVERFIEVHIEQGMILEKSQNSVGVVTHIVGQRRYTVQIIGESNHAGTTPMQFRKDAVSTAAYLIASLTKRAQDLDSQLVATVGKMNVTPNVPNVVAGEVEFSLDIRHHKEEVLDLFCKEIFEEFQQWSERLEIEIAISQWMDVKPVEMDEEMNEWVREIAQKKNIRYQNMISGAGHDAQVFGITCPTSLLFVPSHKGISHSPKEFTSIVDLEIGIDLLTEMLYKLAY